MMRPLFASILTFTLCLSLQSCTNRGDTEHSNHSLSPEKLTELRCGYAVWPKIIEIDPKTGKLSGIFHEYLTELATVLDIKVEWSYEISYGDVPTALASGKIDAFCAGLWPVASRAKVITFVKPIAYNPIYAYSRVGFTPPGSDIQSLNNPQVRIATVDGEFSDLISQRRFKLAETVSLPKLSDGPQLLLTLASKKADVTFTDITSGERFMKAQPGTILQTFPDPMMAYGMTIALEKGNFALKEILDIATDELLNSGVIEHIVSKYQDFPGEILIPARDFSQGE